MAKLIFIRGAIGSGKTSVAHKLKHQYPEIELIEIDQIKIEKYGNPTICCPNQDFPEAGRRARTFLDQVRNVIVIEPLCEIDHYHYVLEATGKSEDSGDVISIWLDCTLATSLERKSDSFSDNIIRSQYTRYPDRYVPRGELIIHTDNLSISEVADQISAYLE